METFRVWRTKQSKKLKSGKVAVYHIFRWYDENSVVQQKWGERTAKSGGKMNETDAEKKRLEIEQDMATGRISRNPPSKMTLSEFVEYHETTEGFRKRETTLDGWRDAGAHAIAALGDIRIAKIDTSAAGTIRKHMKGNTTKAGKARPLADATIRKTLVALRAMLNNAKKRDLIPRNPLVGESLGPPPKKTKRIYSAVEVEAMVEATPELWWKALILLAYTGGLRKGEMLNLRWSDLDTEASIVRVESRDAGTHDIGDGVTVPVFPWEPKTAKSERSVPIPPETMEMLMRLRVQSGASPYIFLPAKRLRTLERLYGTTKPIMSSRLVSSMNVAFGQIQNRATAALAKATEKEAEQASTPKAEAEVVQRATEIRNRRRGTLHDLRKSFGTRAAAAGVPMRELMAHMGHSTIVTTAEFYVDVEESAADRLRSVFSRENDMRTEDVESLKTAVAVA